MATQAERKQKTRKKILRVSTRLFGQLGYQATTIDAIAEKTGLAKGAIYHHFETKEKIFEATYIELSKKLGQEVSEVLLGDGNYEERILSATRTFFLQNKNKHTAQIILKDGPVVFGWRKWRSIDAEHFGAPLVSSVERAIKDGEIAGGEAEYQVRLFVGALGEAVRDCIDRDDYEVASENYMHGLSLLLASWRSR